MSPQYLQNESGICFFLKTDLASCAAPPLFGSQETHEKFSVMNKCASDHVNTAIEKRIRDSGATPPSPEELAVEESLPAREIESALRCLVRSGDLVKVGTFFFHARILAEIKEALCDMVNPDGELSLQIMRNRYRTSRKWMMPLIHYFHECGLTYWDGSRRKLRHTKTNR